MYYNIKSQTRNYNEICLFHVMLSLSWDIIRTSSSDFFFWNVEFLSFSVFWYLKKLLRLVVNLRSKLWQTEKNSNICDKKFAKDPKKLLDTWFFLKTDRNSQFAVITHQLSYQYKWKRAFYDLKALLELKNSKSIFKPLFR